MSGENSCLICGCTETKACVTEDGPCWWMDDTKTICSACAIIQEVDI